MVGSNREEGKKGKKKEGKGKMRRKRGSLGVKEGYPVCCCNDITGTCAVRLSDLDCPFFLFFLHFFTSSIHPVR